MWMNIVNAYSSRFWKNCDSRYGGSMFASARCYGKNERPWKLWLEWPRHGQGYLLRLEALALSQGRLAISSKIMPYDAICTCVVCLRVCVCARVIWFHDIHCFYHSDFALSPMPPLKRFSLSSARRKTSRRLWSRTLFAANAIPVVLFNVLILGAGKQIGVWERKEKARGRGRRCTSNFNLDALKSNQWHYFTTCQKIIYILICWVLHLIILIVLISYPFSCLIQSCLIYLRSIG